MSRNSRQFERFSQAGSVRFSWEGPRGAEFALGRCLDVSRKGMLIETGVPIPLRSNVSIVCDSVSLPGRGIVRHCTRSAMRYRIGLEFSSPLPVPASQES